MNSNVKHVLSYGVVLILLGLTLRFALEEHINRIRVEAKVHEQQAVMDARDQVQKETSAKFDAQIKALQTPQQAAPVIQRIFVPQPGAKTSPGAPVTVRKDQLTPEVQATLPDAPQGKPDAPVMLLTPSQQVTLAQRELTCQKKEGELSTCEADKQSKDKQIKDLQTALKGGSKWSRFVKETKCLAVGGGSAGLGALLNKKSPALGATIGAVAGEATCKVFF